MIVKITFIHLPPQDFLDALKESGIDDDSGVKVVYSKTTCNFCEWSWIQSLHVLTRIRNYMTKINYRTVSKPPDFSSLITFGAYPFGAFIVCILFNVSEPVWQSGQPFEKTNKLHEGERSCASGGLSTKWLCLHLCYFFFQIIPKPTTKTATRTDVCS